MSLTDAEKQAYARVGNSIISLWTLEFRHSDFPSPVRLVNYQSDVTHTLEASAPVDASSAVLFSAVAFQFDAPKISQEANNTVSAVIDGVSGILQPYIAAARQSGEPVEVTIRELLYDVVTDTVLHQPATFHQRVLDAKSTYTSVSVQMARRNSANQPFPDSRYTPASNPGLVE